MTPRVALIGANGHGRSHRRVLARAQQAGALALVGLCDLEPICPEPDAPVPPGTGRFDDYRALLSATRPDAVVICTPPHTHLEIATAAARAGADLLLEKPPVIDTAEHAALAGVLTETGRACQVGFQALGSAALAELTAAVAAGRFGRVTGVSAAGAWQRPDRYYRRAPWAGRRRLGGRPVLDGALVNPFAHALMQCLAIAEAVTGAPARVTGLELERYCARLIEVDDTAVLRARLAGGLLLLVAVTLCADTRLAGEVTVHTERGPAVLGYTEDWLRFPGEPGPREVPGRHDLLANLLAHRADPRVPLVAGLSRTLPFTTMVEAITDSPDPTRIDADWCASHGTGADRVVTVPGVSDLLRRAAATLALPGELGASWAKGPVHTCNIPAYDGP